MSKSHITLIVIFGLLATLLINVLFGDVLAARLSQLPLIKRFNLLNPKAPIVINNRETVRVSDANDAVETINAVRGKISALAYLDADERPVLVGNVLNWTADGYFIGVNGSFAVPNKRYVVITADGTVLDVVNRIYDNASGLVLIDTNASALPTIDSIDDATLRPGQKVLLVASSLGAGKVNVEESYIHKLTHDVAGIVMDSDTVNRGISIGRTNDLILGQAVVDLDGKLVGIWDGDSILSGDAVRALANSFFSDGRAIRRASFGFKYRHLTKVETELAKVPAGADVVSVAYGKAGQLAGLLPSDTIVALNGKKLADDILLESMLETVKPGEVIELSVNRGGQELTLTLTPQILK